MDVAAGVSEQEIFGQLVDENLTEIGINDFRISDIGLDGSPDYYASNPDAAYNPHLNQYLVVWEGIDNIQGSEEREVYAQVLEADGAQSGENDLRVSDMGPDGDTKYFARYPDVEYASAARQYLVTWVGLEHLSGEPNVDEYEVFGQVLLDDGIETGENDFRLSDMGPDGDLNFIPELSRVACGSTMACLVTWPGHDDRIPLVKDEYEIFAQLYELGDGEDPVDPIDPTGYQVFLPMVSSRSE
jgi:hypothetical protein